MGPQPDVMSILAAASRDLAEPGDLDQTLERITRAACDSVPRVDFASISVLHDDGRIETVAPTDPVIVVADKHQYEFKEGPCYQAVTEPCELMIRSPNIGTDPRWPNYGPAALGLGLRAQAALRLFDHPRSQGALNLYSSTAGAFEDPDHLVEMLARQASVALGFASEITNLNVALSTRKTIGQAIGILMERYGIDEDKAFAFLVRASQAGNIKLKDVADELVHMGNSR